MPPPAPAVSEQQTQLDEILLSFGLTRRALLDDTNGSLRFGLVQSLVNDGIFEGASAQFDADRFAGLLLQAANGSDLEKGFWDWLVATRELVDQLEKVREKRQQIEAWHARANALKRAAERAEGLLRYEKQRLAYYSEPALRKEQLFEHYLANVVGNDMAGIGSLAVNNALVDCEMFLLLRDRVIPELKKRADSARAALKEFEKTGPGP